MTEQVQKTEDELMQEASALIAARRNEGKLPPKAETPETTTEPPAESESAETVETSEPDKSEPAPAEPFEGYSALPEAVRQKWDEMMAKAAAAERAEAAAADFRQKYEAMHGRVAPLQRQLDQLQRQAQAAPRPVQHSLTVDEWSKSLTPQMRDYFERFPEDAKAQFEIARDVAERQAAALTERVDQKVHEIERRAELAVLAREHPDFRDYSLNNGTPATQKGAAFWQWTQSQPPHIQELARSDHADDIAAALSLHKWQQRPEVQAAYEDLKAPECQQWLRSQPPAIANLLDSPRIDDRIAVMRMLDQHLRLQEGTKAPDPQTAARVSQIAARREQQGKASPSIRPTVAPHSATTDGNDAGWAAAVAAVRQYQR